MPEHGKYLQDGKIEISEEGIVYWTNQLKCNERDLMDAISKIGTTHNTLIMYLQMNQKLGENE